MAYTYDDFLKTASKANMLERFDKNDLAIAKVNPDYGLSMVSLMKDLDNAATPEARLLAGEAINQLKVDIRPGTLIDDVPTSPTLTDQPEESVPSTPSTGPTQQEQSVDLPAGGVSETGSFSYDNEDEYQKLMAAITNPGTFRYNHEDDPNWSAYRKAYLREGERATHDALALASAATGGIPSTYAITAAQQAGANYADQLAALIPTLEQNAYSRYLNQQEAKMNALQILQADRENEYARYLAQQELQAQQEAAKQELAKEEEAKDAIIPAGDLAYLKEAYPSGQITSKSTWDWLVAEFGEEALNAAGYSYFGYESLPWPNLIGGLAGAWPTGDYADVINGNG